MLQQRNPIPDEWSESPINGVNILLFGRDSGEFLPDLLLPIGFHKKLQNLFGVLRIYPGQAGFQAIFATCFEHFFVNRESTLNSIGAVSSRSHPNDGLR